MESESNPLKCFENRRGGVVVPFSSGNWFGERRLRLVRARSRREAVRVGLEIVEELREMLEEAGVRIEEV